MFSKKQVKAFQKTVFDYYEKDGRHDLPWRTKPTPYRVMVSEIMLQQTQVSRVLVKFAEFLRAFPSVKSLADADQHKLLSVWKGLGYNRRALWLRDAAREIVEKYRGRIPSDPQQLEALKGIGHYTARAIATFAYDMPHALIETNIRRVYLHHFFKNKKAVHDSDILPLIERTLPLEPRAQSSSSLRTLQSLSDLTPRVWYWALMDYGSHLAKTIPNPNRRSRHYAKQPRFEGSNRQIRGKILELLLEKPLSINTLLASFDNDDERVGKILSDLQRDGFIVQKKEKVSIKR